MNSSLAERWAQFILKQSSSPIVPYAFIALGLFTVITGYIESQMIRFVGGFIWFFIALIYFERRGFKEIILKKESEILRLKEEGK